MTSSAYFQPLLAFGKFAAALTSDSMSAGVVEILVDNSADTFVIDDLLFISESDDTEVQFLGKVLDVSPDKTFLTVELPLYLGKAAGAKLWTPTTSFQFTFGPGWNSGWIAQTGVTSRQSRGSQWFYTRVADNSDVLTWNYDKTSWLRSSDYKAFVAWIRDNRRGGLDAFSIAYWDHLEETDGRPRVIQAKSLLRFTDEGPGLRVEVLDGDDATAHKSNAAILLRFVVFADDIYVGS